MSTCIATRSSVPAQVYRPTRRPAVVRKALTCRAGPGAEGGVFAPVVKVVKGAMGEKEFNKLRGKAISLHSEVIKTFCGTVGAPNKQAQLVIRLAKKNGEWLGFLA